MPFQLELPKRLRARGWKVKIREKERLEPPHVTIIFGKKEWRVGLRDKSFLEPPGGRWADIDDEVRELIEKSWKALQNAWDEKYPSNPTSSREEDNPKDNQEDSDEDS
ncbi:MAG: hypothetical protein HY040_02885 [Planctomycetes bacterium]|nr:hypothetical protein [Planctomycetota bacterium]